MATVSDILIIGAGLSGVSLAYELSQKGLQVTVVDSGDVGDRTSATNQGGVRQQFFDRANILAGSKTLEIVAGFEAEMGVDPEFRNIGYAFMMGRQSNTEHYLASVKRQNELGGATTILSPAQIAEQWPTIETSDLTMATFNPDEGCINARALSRGYFEASGRRGVDFRLNEEVIRFETGGDDITRVITTANAYSAGLIINACGPWAAQLAYLYGRTLPVVARLSPIYIADDGPTGVAPIPMVIDVEQQVTVCPNPVGTMVGCSEKVAVEHPGWVPKTNWALMPQMFGKAKKRCPFLAQLSMTASRTGYWEVTPDDHPIIGHDKSLNLFTVAGFSGHGISIVPGLASSIAAAVVGEAPEIDLGLYDPERFENGHSASNELWGSADWGTD